MSNFKVKVQHINADTNEMKVSVFDLNDYTYKIRYDLIGTLKDIEALIAQTLGEEDKAKWPKDVNEKFNNIRSVILDSANNTMRIPANLHVNGYQFNPTTASNFFSSVANQCAVANKISK